MRVWGSLVAVSLGIGFFACASSDDDTSGNKATGGTDAGKPDGSGGKSGTGGTGGTSASGGTTSDAGAGGTGGGTPCTTDSECSGTTPYCDTTAGKCVQCLPTSDTCAAGYYCDSTGTCVAGCTSDNDCDPTKAEVCDTATHKCVGCLSDANCQPGMICTSGACVPGCSATQACPGGQECCTGQCIDTTTDVNNCGGCGKVCPDLAHASESCFNSICGLGTCDAGYLNCNQLPADGCEGSGGCSCTPNSTQTCYFGPTGTAGVGACKSGTQTCLADGSGWGVCNNQVLPTTEVCGNGIDEDCNGIVDDNFDKDGDGWGTCAGDCCDVAGPNCGNPGLVNPGAFEVAGNGVDDDCDGQIDNPTPLCDTGLASNSSNPLDYAKAIDLCKFTTESPPLAQKTWGVISGALLQPSGSGTPAASSRSIRNGFGTNIKNKLGSSLAVISSGVAADNAGDTNPSFAKFQDGQDMKTSSGFPADWLAANGGLVPNAPGCDKAAGTTANDGVMLKLRIRVPTNAQSFQAKLYFFSAEYPEYVCTPFNDFFVSLVDSTATTNPTDKNIAIYTSGTSSWPVGVNLLKAASGLFQQCQNGPITYINKGGKCSVSGPLGTYNGCIGTSELLGTGFDITGTTTYSCGYAGMTGGGTSWLVMKGNVKPGETMEIRFAIWDSADHLFDSLALLDAWQWSVTPSTPGVTPD